MNPYGSFFKGAHFNNTIVDGYSYLIQGVPDYPAKNLSEHRREATNSIHI